MPLPFRINPLPNLFNKTDLLGKFCYPLDINFIVTRLFIINNSFKFHKVKNWLKLFIGSQFGAGACVP